MVTRYEPHCLDDFQGGGAEMLDDVYGGWVDYEDYKELEEKYEKLVGMIGDLWREI